MDRKRWLHVACFLALFAAPFALLWMSLYLTGASIAAMVLVVVLYRLMMTAWLGKPYFNMPREIWIELVHDLLIMACFAWVGFKAGSSLWVAGAGVWLVYIALNQYHGWLNLQRGYGYVSVVGSVAASCFIYVMVVVLQPDPVVLQALYLIAPGAGLGAAVKFLHSYHQETRTAAQRYRIPMLMILACIVLFMMALVSSGHLVTDVSKIAGVPRGPVDFKVALAICLFIASSACCLFTLSQCFCLVMPGESRMPPASEV